MNELAGIKTAQPLVSVSVLLTSEQRRGLDFLARCLGVERRGVLMRALDLLAVAGPDVSAGLGDGAALASVHCGECGCRE